MKQMPIDAPETCGKCPLYSHHEYYHISRCRKFGMDVDPESRPVKCIELDIDLDAFKKDARWLAEAIEEGFGEYPAPTSEAAERVLKVTKGVIEHG